MSSVPPRILPPERPSDERRMSFIEATLWTIGSVVLVVSCWQIVVRAAPAWKDDAGVSALCQMAAYTVLLLLLRTFYFPKTKVSLVFGTRAGSWVFYPIAIVLGAAILFPSSAIYEAALARWPDKAQGSQILANFHDLPRWRQVTAAVGLVGTTPLIEECLFRGALFGTLRRHHPVALVVLSTASLFALVHVQPQLYLPIGMVGAAIAFLRVASGSIWPGVLMHMTFNGLSFYAQVTSPGSSEEPTPTWQVLGGAVVTAGLLALVQHLRSKRGDPEPDLRRPEEEEEP